MDLFAFIQVADHTKVKVGERERAEGEAKLLDSTVRRVVLLLSITLARADSELEASVDMLFDEGGSADEEDFAAGGDQEIETELVMGVRIVADENVVAEKPKRPRKKRQAVTDASGSSHPPKKLKGDHGTSSWAAIVAVATLPLVTSSVFVTLEHESGVPTDSIAGLILRTIGASQRSAGVLPVMTKAVITSHVVNAPSVPVSKSDTADPSYFAKQDLLMGSHELNSKTLHKVFVPQWNVLNDSLLDDYNVSREFVDHLAHPAFFSQICEMDYHHLFTEFNVGTARQACLNAEVRMQTEYCLSERKRLESECEKQAELLKVRVKEVENLKVQLLLKETEAAKAACLRVQVAAEATEKMHVDEIDALKQRNVVLENEKESLNGKVVELQSSVSTKDLELKDLNVDVFSLRSQKDSLVDQEGKSLVNIVAYNPAAKVDYNSALQRLREVEFPLLGKLKSHKDASTVDVMNTLCLEGPLADALGMSDLQPDVEQLTLPIHRPEDQVVLDETSLSFALSEASTSGSMSAAVVTMTTLSTTFSAASSVPPITIEDYEIVGIDGPEDGQGNVASFPTLEFEKEELDTTPKRDPPS
nr:hypothetical protein [Tanacetum cinerariifolium]